MTLETAIPLVNPHLEGSAFLWEAGPVGVLLSHGYTATPAETRPLAQALHQKGYTVCGPLLPGHGTTIEDCNRHGWKDWLAALETAYRQLTLRCEKVFIGGESLGGLLALAMAEQHPQAAGVLLYAPALRFQSNQTWAIPLIALFKTAWRKRSHGPSAADALWQGYPVYPLRGLAQLCALQRRVRPRLPAIRRPLLILQGRLDRTVAADVPEEIVRNVHSPIRQMHWLEHTAHCVILDAERDLAAQLTLNFLEALQ